MNPYTPVRQFGQQRQTFGIRRAVYAATDHLLIVENLGLTEDYTRINYSDIRYIVVSNAKANQLPYIILGLVGIIICFCSFLNPNSAVWVGICIILGIVIIIPSIVMNGRQAAQKRKLMVRLGTDVSLIPIPIPGAASRIPPFIDFLRQRGAPLPTN